MKHAANFARLLAAFFTDRLMQQRQASPHTIASYRDTFRLLVHYALRELKKPPATLDLADLDTDFLGAFLSYLETERGNDPRTRNTRLAAIRSFFGYVAVQEPQHAGLAQRVLALPSKRYTRRPVDFLDRSEVAALLAAPDTRVRAGRRDRTLLLVAVQTGLRASELIQLRCKDVRLGPGAHLRCLGKGRKQRCTPLRKDSAAALAAWLEERRGSPETPVFPNQRGGQLSHDGLAHLLTKHLHCREKGVPVAEEETRHAACPSSHHSNGTAAKRCRPVRDRVVARSRVRRDHLRLSARRSQAEGRRNGQDHSLATASGPLPAGRRGAGIPQQPVIIPSSTPYRIRAPPGLEDLLGIIRDAELYCLFRTRNKQ